MGDGLKLSKTGIVTIGSTNGHQVKSKVMTV